MHHWAKEEPMLCQKIERNYHVDLEDFHKKSQRCRIQEIGKKAYELTEV